MSRAPRLRTLLAMSASVLSLAAVSAPALAQEQTILPGYWDVTNKVSAIISQTKTEKRCITPADVEKFMSGPSNRHYTCTYPTKVFSGGKIRLKGTCVSKKQRKVEVQGTGAYTPTSFNLTAEIATEFGIAVNLEEMVKPAWLDEAALDAMEARQRAQAGGKA